MEKLALNHQDRTVAIGAETKLLMKLVGCRSLPDAKRIVRELERRHRYDWHPVGNRENNYGIINIGSDPGYALVERITNAIDAVVELSAVVEERSGDRYPPRSPRQAVEKWHGIRDGRLKNIDSTTRQKLADNVMVRLWDGSRVKTPTVEIRDLGIGLTAALLPGTILGLNEGNKIDKLYLAGAYGQGGSTALAFSPDGALIVSRRQPTILDPSEQDAITVTFARYSDLDPSRNKNGRYEYLRRADGSVASFPATLLPEFLAGTAVVHFDLQIPQYSDKTTQLRGSLRWLLENALFDPVLPLWVEDRRRRFEKTSQQRQTLAGNHSRLAEDKRDRVEHSSSVEVVLDHQAARSVVWVHYWVIREAEDGKRKRPIDVYVDPYRPVAYTYFGQTHGTDDQRFVADRIRFPYLAKFLILQVELDGLAPRARRDLLSTTRDRLKQSALYEEMRDKIALALAADPELTKINELRKESLLTRHSDAERVKMRQRFARLMDRHKAGTDARVGGGRDLENRRTMALDAVATPLTPLPVGAEPTFLRIANRQSPIPIRKNRSALILLESDAPDGFLTASGVRLILETEPEGRLSRSSASDFLGGRSRVLVQPERDTIPGDRGKLNVYLITPRAETLTATAPYLITRPEERQTSGKGRSHVQAPDPIPVHRNEWASLDWNAASVAEVREGCDQSEILVNMDNRHLRRLLDAAGYKEAGYRRVSNAYLLYVAFYAWLQHRGLQGDGLGLEGEAFENYRQTELDRAAQTVIHSISSEGRLEE